MSDRQGVEVGHLELTDEQRERLDRIKAECKEADPGLPEPSDEQILDSLLDTWDAVDEALYSGGKAESGKALDVSVNDWSFGVYVARAVPQEGRSE